MQPDDKSWEGSIRVLAADIPDELYQTLAEAINLQPDLRLIGRVWHRLHHQNRLDLLLAVGAGVDVLLLGAAQVHPPPGICTHLLSEFPDIKIFVLTLAGDQAMLYWRGLRQRPLSGLSAATLQGEIRDAYAINPAL